MTPVIRMWLGFAAIGAALIHLAVGAGAPLPLSILLVGFGLTELGWAVVTLSQSRPVAIRVAFGATLIPVLVFATTATLGSGLGVSAAETGLPMYPMVIASLFNLYLAGSLAVIIRKKAHASPAAVSERTRTVAQPGGWRFLTALVVAGLVVSGLTTPALAATNAGLYAVPHGAPSGVHSSH
ncbi:hypothetical protein E3T39_03350 [Cryobacterium suzukii]|uniref:Uncharacterized protein n=1 Tax=Cryobacterium suzukii TaxID=1259198 RepID=A0A4R9AIY0_9MICO|nr:hypothetical protein [Cryobacterium suzukii]TFD62059.1 hypothetical protein E3T39_03350 [Cryobacterium suzukii]